MKAITTMDVISRFSKLLNLYSTLFCLIIFGMASSVSARDFNGVNSLRSATHLNGTDKMASSSVVSEIASTSVVSGTEEVASTSIVSGTEEVASTSVVSGTEEAASTSVVPAKSISTYGHQVIQFHHHCLARTTSSSPCSKLQSASLFLIHYQQSSFRFLTAVVPGDYPFCPIYVTGTEETASTVPLSGQLYLLHAPEEKRSDASPLQEEINKIQENFCKTEEQLPGMSNVREIEKAITNSNYFLIFLSKLLLKNRSSVIDSILVKKNIFDKLVIVLSDLSTEEFKNLPNANLLQAMYRDQEDTRVIENCYMEWPEVAKKVMEILRNGRNRDQNPPTTAPETHQNLQLPKILVYHERQEHDFAKTIAEEILKIGKYNVLRRGRHFIIGKTKMWNIDHFIRICHKVVVIANKNFEEGDWHRNFPKIESTGDGIDHCKIIFITVGNTILRDKKYSIYTSIKYESATDSTEGMTRSFKDELKDSILQPLQNH
ncbi:hypothetical protein TrispH2_006824 [Trichoplax sp. H2]|nr:hypothetical protein TrispH2_006824 [Trichoplax sp. H2]|eukprot:RDD42256.1 hypothetical protein TrispH2_006824 [Trichoplax sp. H2]